MSYLTLALRRPSPRTLASFMAVIFAALFLALAGSALAAPLDVATAKSQGLVGEQADGYLGIVKPPGSAAVQKLVAETNLQRRENYSEIASANGISLEAVEQLAGKKLVEGAKPGEFVRGSDGVWVQK